MLDGCESPAADNLIEETAPIQEPPSLTKRKLPDPGQLQVVRRIVGAEGPLTAAIVEILVAADEAAIAGGPAAVINGFAEGVSQNIAEAPLCWKFSRLNLQGMVDRP